jgi:hypothetical protein
MFLRVLKFVRLPILLILLFAIGRFMLGLRGVPYAPRGNAMFSIVGVTLVSSFYFGALSRKVGGFGWGGTVLVGVILGLFAQILIFSATLISYLAGLNTYFIHWDALNIPEGTTITMAEALSKRAGGLAFGWIFVVIVALIGRVLSVLAPNPAAKYEAEKVSVK